MPASSSKNLPALMPSKAKSGTALVNENIDPRILRLLGLEDIFDIDYDTYSSLLRERMAAARMTNKTLPTEEVEMITNEWKRVKGKKGRFKVKKITASSFKKGTAVGINLRKQKLLPGVKPLALPPAADQLVGKSDVKEIIDALGEIIKNLTLLNKNQKDSEEKKRKKSEAEKRGLAESALEKGFKGAIKVAEKIIAPIKSLLGRIIDYFTAIFLGRVVFKLLEWFGNPDNAEKIKSIGRFLGDHWPKLLSLYLLFGTQFGGFVRSLISLLVKGGASLLRAALGLAAKAGLGKAGKVAGFLGGKGGKLLVAGVEAATTVGATMALSSGIENFGGIGGQKFAGGGYVRPKFPSFGGGGFSGGLGAMFGPLGALLGGLGNSSGFVSGEKGVDKIPAMLSDGEFVMSRGAVAKYGVDTLEAMNAAGGGTNKPKIMSGTAYAKGGGLMGSEPQDYKKEKVKDPVLEKRERELRSFRSPQNAGSVSNLGMTYKEQELALAKAADAAVARREKMRQQGGKMVKFEYKDRSGMGTGEFYERYRSEYDNKFYKNRNDALAAHQSRLSAIGGIGARLSGGASTKKIDIKQLPKTQIMTGPDGRPFVGHLTIKDGKPMYQRPGERKKGFLEGIADFFNPSGAKTREDQLKKQGMRMSAIDSLAYYKKIGMTDENIDKQLKKLGVDPKQARNDLAAKEKRQSKLKGITDASHRAQEQNYYKMRGVGGMGGLGSNYRGQELALTAKANAAKISPSKPTAKPLTPPSRPPVVVKTKPVGSGKKGGGLTKPIGGSPKTPNFGATCPSSNARKNKKILGIF